MDDLQDILSRADRPAAPPRPDLADAVRQIVGRRRKRRRVVGATLAILVVVVGTWAMLPRPGSFIHVPPPPLAQRRIDVAAIRREIADLGAQAKVHQRIAGEIESALSRDQELFNANVVLSKSDAFTHLEECQQATAQLMLSHATNLDLDPRWKVEAMQSYRTLAQLFPRTLAGRTATTRLNAGV